MKNTKYLFLLLCSMFLIGQSFAQKKILESSSKKTPVWVNSAEKDYIIVSSIKNNIEDAKAECLENIKKEIIKSIANNVSFESSTNETQTTENNSLSFKSNFESVLHIQSANIPFIKGISLSKATESYWAKRRDKATKAEDYIFAVKYPFPSKELKMMVMEFEERDEQMMSKLKALKDGINNINSIDEIGKAINELQTLKEYFFDNVRKSEAKNLAMDYANLYQLIQVNTLEEDLGISRMQFSINGKVLSSSIRPAIKAENASQMKYETANGVNTLKYNCDYAPKGSDNEISLTYRFSGRTLVHTIYFNVPKNTKFIRPINSASIEKITVSDTTKLNVSLDMKCDQLAPFSIQKFSFNIPQSRNMIVVEDIDFKVEENGIFVFKIQTPIVKDLDLAPANKVNLLRGQMIIKTKNQTEEVSITTYFDIK